MTALTALVALAMLVTALDGSIVAIVVIAVALALGVLVTVRYVDEEGRRPLAVRIAVGLASVGSLAYIAVGLG